MAEKESAKNGAARTMVEIRSTNEEKILAAAENIFAERGFSGASMSAIARDAALPKANLHYYFGTKEGLYRQVLQNTIELWLHTGDPLTADADPATAFAAYIRAKMDLSRRRPGASKVFANEILHGAPLIDGYMRTELRQWVQEKGRIFEGWAARGLITPVSAEHLFFTLWAATQTYADFGCQVAAVLGKTELTDQDFETAATTLINLVLGGLGCKSAV